MQRCDFEWQSGLSDLPVAITGSWPKTHPVHQVVEPEALVHANGISQEIFRRETSKLSSKAWERSSFGAARGLSQKRT